MASITTASKLKRGIRYLIIIIALLTLFIFAWLQQPQYASPVVAPQADNPLYRDGQFFNAEDPPPVTRTQSRLILWYRFLFGKDEGAQPDGVLPSQKTNLHQLKENAVVWMGHSSYFLRLDGKNYLIDPVFSDYASPIPRTNVAFSGSNIYRAEDIPPIDYLLITHDHWDHLDYPTINALRDKIGQIITPTGVGSYFEKWGFPKTKIFEGGWNSAMKTDGLEIHILPAQHFSGRFFKRNQTLWASYGIITPNQRIYFGGDSGYGRHFKDIAARFGGFDLAVLECGQYDAQWPFIHMTPEDAAKAASDLQAKAVLPSHNSKFKLAHHRWNEPLERLAAASANQPWRLLTPKIGETVQMDNSQQTFIRWWQNNNEQITSY